MPGYVIQKEVYVLTLLISYRRRTKCIQSDNQQGWVPLSTDLRCIYFHVYSREVRISLSPANLKHGFMPLHISTDNWFIKLRSNCHQIWKSSSQIFYQPSCLQGREAGWIVIHSMDHPNVAKGPTWNPHKLDMSALSHGICVAPDSCQTTVS